MNCVSGAIGRFPNEIAVCLSSRDANGIFRCSFCQELGAEANVIRKRIITCFKRAMRASKQDVTPAVTQSAGSRRPRPVASAEASPIAQQYKKTRATETPKSMDSAARSGVSATPGSISVGHPPFTIAANAVRNLNFEGFMVPDAGESFIRWINWEANALQTSVLRPVTLRQWAQLQLRASQARQKAPNWGMLHPPSQHHPSLQTLVATRTPENLGMREPVSRIGAGAPDCTERQTAGYGSEQGPLPRSEPGNITGPTELGTSNNADGQSQHEGPHDFDLVDMMDLDTGVEDEVDSEANDALQHLVQPQIQPFRYRTSRHVRKCLLVPSHSSATDHSTVAWKVPECFGRSLTSTLMPITDFWCARNTSGSFWHQRSSITSTAVNTRVLGAITLQRQSMRNSLPICQSTAGLLLWTTYQTPESHRYMGSIP